MTLREANAFVEQNHRHHGATVGHKFSIGLSDGEKIVGVAIVGRPVSRHLDDGWTLEVKALLYQRLAVQEEGPNYCHFPREKDRGYTQEYFKGLTAEKMVISYKRGKAQYVWTLKDGGYKRNEPLDIRNYATVALEIANPILKPPEHDTTAPTPRRRGRRSRTNGGIL